MIKFSLMERTASFVPRWAIAPTHNTQSLAEHSYYVSLYASKIAKLLGMDHYTQLRVVNYALRHDAHECRISDIPGPVKRAICDLGKLDRMVYDINTDLGPDYEEAEKSLDDAPAIKAVIKVADGIDEVLYLQTERLMGNRLLDKVAEDCYGALVENIERLSCDKHVQQQIRGKVDVAIADIDRGVQLPRSFYL